MAVFLLIMGLVLFVGLVVVHEFGHFIAAKRSGVEVEEFGIGFPPRAKILSKKNGTIFTLNWLPLGGFVKLKGEHDSDTTSGSFGAASLANKVKIMLAGVGMNLATAFVLFTLLALLGMPKLIDDQFTVAGDTKVSKQQIMVGYVEADSPAQKAGLKLEDTLVGYFDPQNPVDELAADGLPSTIPFEQVDSLQKITPNFAGRDLGLKIQTKQGETKSLTIRLRSMAEVEASKKTSEPKGYLGLAPTQYTTRRSTWSAPIVAVGVIKQFTELTLKGIGSAVANLFRGNTTAASSQVSGPVGIFVLLQNGSLLGYEFILMIVAVISLTLAIMNALPIPALDGGRLFVTLLYRAIRKPLKKTTEERIHGTGFALLMVLFVLITIVDVRRNF